MLKYRSLCGVPIHNYYYYYYYYYYSGFLGGFSGRGISNWCGVRPPPGFHGPKAAPGSSEWYFKLCGSFGSKVKVIATSYSYGVQLSHQVENDCTRATREHDAPSLYDIHNFTMFIRSQILKKRCTGICSL